MTMRRMTTIFCMIFFNEDDEDSLEEVENNS